MDREVPEVWQVETVEPDHRTGGVIAMIVPRVAGGEDNVSAAHFDPFAVHCGKATNTFDNETHSKGGMPMCRCSLVGHDQLETGIESIRGVWCGWP